LFLLLLYSPTIYRGIDSLKKDPYKGPLSINSILITSFNTSSILLIRTRVVYYEYVTNLRIFFYLSTHKGLEEVEAVNTASTFLLLNIPFI
jgi:hypothetical protein